ncbi:hypothetical protein [Stappia indica]|uniref:hypothetical protein n=1 Tax=Stappia indica TaxID=538381 RepID=UPI001CD3C7A4|nr:hypothetical protein [Stappia indica]MCA1298764.1 hypothetical protein [Stappia indica]
MSLQVMGILTFALGLLLMGRRPQWMFMFMAVSTVFGTAAAISLPALGGASILVPNLFLVFFFLRMYAGYGEGPILSAFALPGPGFWLLLLTVFGVLSGIFLPRLFAGMTETISVTRMFGARNFISMVPLRPTASNITQSVYAIGGLLCFAASYTFFRQTRSAAALVGAMLVLATVDLVFALADIVTYFSGTAWLMDFFRTANYGMLTDSVKGGLKRISGTFSEASAFASYTLAVFAVVASLWLDRLRNGYVGLLAAALFLAVLLSTSATGLAGLVVVVGFLGIRSLSASLANPRNGRPSFLVMGAIVGLLAMLVIMVAMPQFVDQIEAYLDEILFSKANSQSGRERFQWNAAAFQTFLDTSWIGAGLGSSRASSFLLVLLSNLGVAGAMLFLLFAGSVLLAPNGVLRSDTGAVADQVRAVRAAKAGFAASLATAMISGTVYDLGLLPYLLAGGAAALSRSVRERQDLDTRAVPLAPLRGKAWATGGATEGRCE